MSVLKIMALSFSEQIYVLVLNTIHGNHTCKMVGQEINSFSFIIIWNEMFNEKRVGRALTSLLNNLDYFLHPTHTSLFLFSE